MADRDGVPRAPEAVERFVKQLVVAYKAVRLYPRSSTIPRENAAAALSVLHAIFREKPSLRLGVSRDALIADDAPVFADQPAFQSFSREFYNRRLAEVRFHGGVTEGELLQFLGALDVAPEDLVAAGGFEARLWEAGVDNITVKEISQRIVDVDVDEAAEKLKDIQADEPWPPDPERVGELLAGALAGRPRDQRLLVRVIEQPSLVSAYLRRSLDGRGTRPTEAWVTSRLVELARVVSGEVPGDQEALYRGLAEAIMELDPDLRASVLRGRFVDEARHDEAVASVLRAMGLKEAFSALVGALESESAGQSGLARALRNLATVKVAGRDQVADALAAALDESGLGAEYKTHLIEEVVPSRVHVPRRRRDDERPVESVLRLLDVAPGQVSVIDEPALEGLREEARRGVTDGDVLGVLVTIATLDRRSAQFSSVMSLLEDSLGLLVERQEFDAAESAAAALTKLLEQGRLGDPERQRVEGVLTSLASTPRMRIVTSAMRLHKPGTPEHDACHRLLTILTGYAITPLLEVLADEPDMAARKAIIELISGLSVRYIGALGSRVTDSRWYFVRNVVTILAATRDPEVLPYLERTLRHNDARVRRETIRALANIPSPRAQSMTVAALGDEEAQNVQLAARFLGTTNVRGAVPALMQVAAGEGSGNRDLGPRVDAIESLGRLGATEAIPLLTSISRQRALLGGARVRELRAAATSALGAIKAAAPRAEGGDR